MHCFAEPPLQATSHRSALHIDTDGMAAAAISEQVSNETEMVYA